ncbi:MAG: cytochrome c3 family protein [Chloroflexi bacterium]|nr:cytochrome c3 family protein [Chloroflexota bacterium]
MPQVFHRSANTFSRLSIFGAVFILAALVLAMGIFVRSSYATGVGNPVNQPVPFSHKQHVADDGLDCRYCHISVETSAFAGIPPTKTCMNCHAQIWADSPALAPVRDSYATGRPLVWNRVHALPDYVYFDHSIHVAKGVGCAACHGPIEQMALTAKAETLQMEWCLNCHRDPAAYLRPRDQVFNITYQPPANQRALGEKLMKEYNVQIKTDCTVCHR